MRERHSDRELLAYLLSQYDRVVEVHAHVRMDTPEDRELHDRAVEAFRDAAQPVRDALSGVPAERRP